MYSLILALVLLITYGIVEFSRHKRNRKKIPCIVHINGTRGKSSVTRLIAAGLRGGDKKVLAKTTGSAPRLIFENGTERPVFRFFGANIREQLKVIRYAAKRKTDILVLECMAVTPEYQWVCEHQMVKSDIGVMTNTRLDHLDVMGPGIKNCTLSLCNTLPDSKLAFTSEKKMFPLMKKASKEKNTHLEYTDPSFVSDEMMQGFNYIEHKDNVALSLAVCEELGVDRDVALKRMYDVRPDIGAAEIFKINYKNKNIYFAHFFAANDPESTKETIKYVQKLYSGISQVSIVLSTRADRMFRSKQLISMLPDLDFEKLFLIGEQKKTIKGYAVKDKIPVSKILSLGFIKGEELVESAVSNCSGDTIFLIGVGNIGGNGGKIVEYFKNRSKK